MTKKTQKQKNPQHIIIYYIMTSRQNIMFFEDNWVAKINYTIFEDRVSKIWKQKILK